MTRLWRANRIGFETDAFHVFFEEQPSDPVGTQSTLSTHLATRYPYSGGVNIPHTIIS